MSLPADLDISDLDTQAQLRVIRAFRQHESAGYRELASTREQMESAAITAERAERRAERDAERNEHELRRQLERQA